MNGYVDPREVCDQQYDAGAALTVRVYFEIVPAVGSCRIVTGCLETRLADYIDVGTEDKGPYEVVIDHVIYPVTATRSGAGTVTSADGSILCGPVCTHDWAFGTAVSLTAKPDIGAVFTGWAGACSGQDATCDLVVSGATTTNAIFELIGPPTPTPPAAATPRVTDHPTASHASTPPPTVAATTSASTSPSEPASTSDGATPTPFGATADPAVPVATGAGSGTLPLVLAILGASLFIAIAIGLIGVRIARRRA